VEWVECGVLECWSVGVLECWSVGVLECWSVGVLECWSIFNLLCMILDLLLSSLAIVATWYWTVFVEFSNFRFFLLTVCGFFFVFFFGLVIIKFVPLLNLKCCVAFLSRLSHTCSKSTGSSFTLTNTNNLRTPIFVFLHNGFLFSQALISGVPKIRCFCPFLPYLRIFATIYVQEISVVDFNFVIFSIFLILAFSFAFFVLFPLLSLGSMINNV